MQIHRIGLAIAVVLILAACGSSSHRVPHNRPVLMSVVLSSHSLRLGYRLAATVVVENRSGHAIPVTCDRWFELGLANSTIENVMVGMPAPCPQGGVLKTGTTRFPVMIPSRFLTCLGGASAGPSEPSCVLSGGPHNHLENPYLPAGRYRTKVELTGIASSLVDLPAAQTVNLRS